MPRALSICHLLPTPTLVVLFVCYGVGTAAWQGSAMALVGDLFRHDEDEHRASFAHLKLTSGAATSCGFWIFAQLPLRASAAISLGANVLGLTGIVCLLVCEALHARAHASARKAAPIVYEHNCELIVGDGGTRSSRDATLTDATRKKGGDPAMNPASTKLSTDGDGGALQ